MVEGVSVCAHMHVAYTRGSQWLTLSLGFFLTLSSLYILRQGCSELANLSSPARQLVSEIPDSVFYELRWQMGYHDHLAICGCLSSKPGRRQVLHFWAFPQLHGWEVLRIEMATFIHQYCQSQWGTQPGHSTGVLVGHTYRYGGVGPPPWPVHILTHVQTVYSNYMWPTSAQRWLACRSTHIQIYTQAQIKAPHPQNPMSGSLT